MVPLCEANLSKLDKRIRLPGYERAGLARGMLHLGVGGFHRAHQAAYTDEVLAAGERAWGILGVGILKQDERMRDALNSQDCLYTLVSKSRSKTEARVVGSIAGYLYGGDSTAGVVDALCAGETRTAASWMRPIPASCTTSPSPLCR
jgi:mannitol 2-dehydrogenase